MARHNENKRPTPVRLGVDAWAAVTAMREALGDLRGVDAGKVTVTEAVELLLTQNFKTAQALAGNPDALKPAPSARMDFTDEVWEALAEQKRMAAHSQGSLHIIARKLNFGETVEKVKVEKAIAANYATKRAAEHAEQACIDFVEAQQD